MVPPAAAGDADPVGRERARRSQSPGTKVSADESTTTVALGAGIGRWIDPDVSTVSFHGTTSPPPRGCAPSAGTARAHTGAGRR